MNTRIETPRKGAPLSVQNAQVTIALGNLYAAVYHLNDLGCTVTRIEAGERNPVIWIDGTHSRFLQGAITRRVVCNGRAFITYAARVHDVQVQWEQAGEMGVEALSL